MTDIPDIITCATFFGDDRPMGLGAAWGQLSQFPIDIDLRPYNTRNTVRSSVWFEANPEL